MDSFSIGHWLIGMFFRGCRRPSSAMKPNDGSRAPLAGADEGPARAGQSEPPTDGPD